MDRGSRATVTSTATTAPVSWKQLLHSVRRCSVDCWCNFCRCEARRKERKEEEGEQEAPQRPEGRYRSLSWRMRPKSTTRLCRQCARCLPALPPPATEEQHHTHYVKVPWEVFNTDSKLTTLFSYKDGWEKKPLWLSPPFWLEELEWRVMCFPKGVPSGPSGCISLFLECASLCKCKCHTREGGEHHFHTGIPHPEHADQTQAAQIYDSISVSFSLALVRPKELLNGTRVYSVTKEATHSYRFGVPVDSGWRNMASTAELERCKTWEVNADRALDEKVVYVEVRVRVDSIKLNDGKELASRAGAGGGSRGGGSSTARTGLMLGRLGGTRIIG